MACVPDEIVQRGKGKCQICNERDADAYWMASPEYFYVCQGCAVEKLPTLIVDSMRIMDRDRINTTLERVKSAFWRAATLRLLREVRNND
ncbi:hypothetical protein CA54_40870 [Symmachiella macrocystis]|uniref:Uncharacterized protein n=1 Tax=Symmachiella macrocystis TaxID=2527985 RepID=A0A5C6BA45_9PLAN|nr:hypothetical protein [Symmachiella macrocystis]TWU08850.1 hypothetical protein CA54_40870 [Symmachiella macrocystis]